MIENSAVFVRGDRKFKNVNVDVTDTEIIVKNRMNGVEMARYSVVDVVKQDMAWDLADGGRIVVQQGCGCSGMRPWDVDQAYKDRHNG